MPASASGSPPERNQLLACLPLAEYRSLLQDLEPVHIEDEFGPDPDIAEVDRVIRKRMQAALDELAKARRFPVLG